jgi:hypothetical protein
MPPIQHTAIDANPAEVKSILELVFDVMEAGELGPEDRADCRLHITLASHAGFVPLACRREGRITYQCARPLSCWCLDVPAPLRCTPSRPSAKGFASHPSDQQQLPPVQESICLAFVAPFRRPC